VEEPSRDGDGERDERARGQVGRDGERDLEKQADCESGLKRGGNGECAAGEQALQMLLDSESAGGK
jgi:hypothetical protein